MHSDRGTGSSDGCFLVVSIKADVAAVFRIVTSTDVFKPQYL